MLFSNSKAAPRHDIPQLREALYRRVGKSWEKQFFTLKGKVLSGWGSEAELEEGESANVVIVVERVLVDNSSQGVCVSGFGMFVVTGSGPGDDKVVHLCTETEKDREKWVLALGEAINEVWHPSHRDFQL